MSLHTASAAPATASCAELNHVPAHDPRSLSTLLTPSPPLLCTIAGPYYPEGFKPVTLFADSVNVRAWPGGVGDCKVGGNYAPTIRPQAEAAGKGFSQVLWLLGHEDGGQLTEVGTMNLFIFHRNEDGEDELVTPPLDGTILPGVTRDSVLALARKWGDFKVSERNMTVGEFTRAIDAGRVRGSAFRMSCHHARTSLAAR